jgi:calcium-dependent protein kinase
MGCIPCQRHLISVSTITPGNKVDITGETEKKSLKEQKTKFQTFKEHSGELDMLREGSNYRLFRQRSKEEGIHFVYLLDKNPKRKTLNNVTRNDLSDKLASFKKLNHANNTQIDDIHISNRKIQIKTQTHHEDNIFDKVIKCSDLLAEHEIKKIMRFILETIHYYHSNDIADYDFSPEKVFVEYTTMLSIKFVNFGLYHTLNRLNLTRNKARSNPFFLAPEVIEGGDTSSKADMWSCGIIMYLLFFGEYPLNTYTLDEYTASLKCEVKLNHYVKSVSNNAKDLIKALLELKPENRPTAEEALRHEWFISKVKPSITSSGCLVLRQDILENLKKFHSRHKLLTGIAGYINNKVNQTRAKIELENIFKQCEDRIGLDDLVFCVERVMSPIETKFLVEKCYNKLDITNQGLEYNTFLANAFEVETINLHKLFDSFVKIHYSSSRLTRENLKSLLLTGMIYDKLVLEMDLFQVLLEELELQDLNDYGADNLVNLLNNIIKIIYNNN